METEDIVLITELMTHDIIPILVYKRPLPLGKPPKKYDENSFLYRFFYHHNKPVWF